METRGDPTFSLDATPEPLKNEKPQLESVMLYDMLIKGPCDSFEELLQYGRLVEHGSQDVVKKARWFRYLRYELEYVLLDE